ncbi:Response regulator receiver domain-containing protein [Paraburkholderia caballeronis]|uniref:Response regulator receiver domain-containing protein n=2 Tax=Paraburkholderia caballeronis TaxID=416943 RepID=A0A1H7L6B2_9BURK|nr:response regulator receiver domain-containing protein [Paraburkholderia caballeronis]PXX03678.1 response regulator receiver domain-containing protein [Paraburkholderia caballeronis]RAK04422.1 response regulator receiver domain-containing protein [Paraburkholderia caballeronis]SEK94498.1 Response regulator receiver domain-containing protein [Paraburkholderia caballeronis]
MSGIELHERLLSLGYAIPVILVTAAETPDTLARARRNGVLAIFPKPFDPTEMQYWLSRALAGDPGFSS